MGRPNNLIQKLDGGYKLIIKINKFIALSGWQVWRTTVVDLL